MYFWYIINCASSNIIVCNDILYKYPCFCEVIAYVFKYYQLLKIVFVLKKMLNQYSVVNVCFSNFHCVHFHSKVTTFKNALAILLIITIAWVLWVLSSQIWNRATIRLFLFLMLSQFIVKVDSVFLRYISIKVFMDPFIIVSILFLPRYSYC